MSNRSVRHLLLLGVVSSALLAQSGPMVYSAGNAADFSANVAQGSLIVISGSSLGPATPVTASTFPLSNTLSGTSVTVTSGSTTLNCPVTYTSAGEVTAILPSNTSLGFANITVSYNGQTGSNEYSSAIVTVVASSVGIFTTTGTGLGTGNFTAPGNTAITFANSAKPGETVTAQATGLGPIGTPDNVLPTSFPNFPNVQVWVGSQAAQIVSDARSASSAGIDQISFTAPAVTAGCNVPVTVVSGGNLSNTVTLPVSASGGACSDSGPTPPTSVLTKAAAGQSVKAAMIGIGPKGIGNGGSAQAVAERLSAELHTRVPAADAAKLMRAYASRNPRAIRNAMAKYARQWKALDAKTKARITAQLGQTQEGAAALFESYSGEGLAATMVTAQFPPAGACVILPQRAPSAKPLVSAALDAGSSLSLTGAAGFLTLISGRKGQYHAVFGSSITGPDVPLGSYTISGTGGADVGAFSSTITVGSHLAISNKSSLDAVNPTQPSTITWTGGVAGNYVLIAGYTPGAFSNNESLPRAFFYCTEDGGIGTLTIPSYILTAMNAAANAQGLLLISPHPLSNQIAIPGLDLAYFIDGSSDSANVTWSGATALAAPVLSAPANNATGVPAAPILAWSASTGATSYVVYLGTSSSPPQVATVTGTTYSPPLLSANTTYYWKVAAANANGNATSPTFSFTTKVTGTGSQTIAFGPIGNQTLGSGSVPLAAIASSGLPVAFTSNSPAVCTVSGPILTLVGTGACSITASQPGNSVYAAAIPVTQTFTVSSVTTGPQALQLITVAPCRIMDTRNANGLLGGPFIAGGTTRTIPIPSSPCGIPANASAYSLNFTVVPRGALNYLSVWPAGQAQPLVSTLNSLDGSTIANAAIVPAGVAGAINAFATNDTDLIVDINGYFAPPAANSLQFYPLTPCRVLDTRNPPGAFGGPSIAGGTSRTFPIPSSSCGVPANAAAYAFNVTVVPQGELAYLTVWPTGQPLPLVSTLNSFDGTTLANAAIVPAGAGGAANFYASNTTDLAVDINGYFAPPGSGGLNFYPVTPCRLVDTRNAIGALGGPTPGPSTTRPFPLSSGSCGLPGFPGAQAYSLNMTVVPQGFLAYLSTWPTGAAQPVVSTLNAFKGQVVANAAIVPAGGAGSINVFVTNTTDVIIDTNGYFGP